MQIKLVLPEIIPNYHPILVHFTIALVGTSFGTFILAQIIKSWSLLQKELLIVSRWCLWLGAMVSTLTVAAGFHAYLTVAHDTPSHHIMTIHRNWALVAYVSIVYMAIISFISYIKHKILGKLFVLGMLITCILVMITGFYGAELVYRYGIGVKSLPKNIDKKIGHEHGGYVNKARLRH